MEVTTTGLDGVLLIKPAIFEDFRGEYVETYNREGVPEARDYLRFHPGRHLRSPPGGSCAAFMVMLKPGS